MQTKIAATKFKEQCLALLEKLPADGIVITKHGRMLARVIPYREGNAELIGSLAEKIVIEGDLESTGVAWDADGQP
jgi:antitoxin (DNA-binding transcriptional repressor) of toxin-antitoxin stability system